MYHHTEDIDRSRTFDADDLDGKMSLLMNRTVSALNDLPNQGATFYSLNETLLRTFIATHKSIRLLLKEEDTASDAMSLVREQLEKVFLLALIFDDPKKWILVYFKDHWRRNYEYEVLLNDEERKNLPECEVNETQRNRWQVLQANANVSNLEREWIEFKFKNIPTPPRLAGAKIDQFPMPGNAKKLVSDTNAKEFLGRLHREYKHICGYTHVGMDKLQVVGMKVVKNNLSESEKEIFLEKALVHPAYGISCLTVACACTEAYNYLKQNDADIAQTGQLLEILFEFWSVLCQQSLLAKVFWDIRAKHVLPPLIQLKI